MSYPKRTPLDDDEGKTDRAVENLAQYLGCNERVVGAAMHDLPLPGWSTPEHQDTLKENIKAFNKAIQYAGALAKAMGGLSEFDRQSLIQAGCVTYEQVLSLYSELQNHERFLNRHYKALPRAGGKNHAALSVAKIVLRSFRIIGKRITWGSNEKGEPTTDYGRAVEFAMSEFCVRADWRHAARVTYDEYERRQFATFSAILRTKMPEKDAAD